MKKLLLCTVLAACGLAQAEPVAMNIDPTHTFVTYEIAHMGASTSRGRFDKKEGKLVWDRAAKTGSVEISFDPASVNTGIAPLDTHLKSKDFFNVAEFPAVKFVGDKFTYDGDNVASVSGTLTLLGKSQPLTLKATRFTCYVHPYNKRNVCGGDFEASFLRSSFGMNYGLPMVVGDEVRLKIQIEAVKAD